MIMLPKRVAAKYVIGGLSLKNIMVYYHVRNVEVFLITIEQIGKRSYLEKTLIVLVNAR